MEHALWLREDTRGRDKWHLSQTTYATPDWVDVSYCGRVYVNVGPDTVTAERPSGELMQYVRIPEEVTIGPYRYRVIVSDKIVSSKGEDMAGFSSTSSEIIELWSGMTARGRYEVFVHEALHAMSNMLPYHLQLTEDHVQALAPYLTAFMFQVGRFEPEPLTEFEEAARKLVFAASEIEHATVDGC